MCATCVGNALATVSIHGTHAMHTHHTTVCIALQCSPSIPHTHTFPCPRILTRVALPLQALAKFLVAKGYKLTTEGTENHLMLWDLRPLGLTGATAV